MNDITITKNGVVVKQLIQFAKLTPKAIIPNKKDEDAGYDIWACIEEDFIKIDPLESVLIHTGICTHFPEGYVMVLKERSSTGLKGISLRSGIVDQSYEGEIGVIWTNCSNKSIYLSNLPEEELYEAAHREPGSCTYYSTQKAICQALLLSVANFTVDEVSKDAIQRNASERSSKGYGSTNK